MVGNILVVDDDAQILLYLRALLGAEGYEVMAVRDVDTAMQHYRDASFDLVLTDLSMPGRDGLQLISSIRSLADITPAAIILITANKAVHLETLEEGVRPDALLPKPVHAGVLLLTVDRLLYERRERIINLYS